MTIESVLESHGVSRERVGTIRYVHRTQTGNSRLEIRAENETQIAALYVGSQVLSFWFTCDASKQFADFLDGKLHQRYGTGEH